MKTCAYQPTDLDYAPCTRERDHTGPCAHPLTAKPRRWKPFLVWGGVILALYLFINLFALLERMSWQLDESRKMQKSQQKSSRG